MRHGVDDNFGKLLEAQAALLTLAKREEELNACKLLLHAAQTEAADLRARLALTEERLERARTDREEAWEALDAAIPLGDDSFFDLNPRAVAYVIQEWP